MYLNKYCCLLLINVVRFIKKLNIFVFDLYIINNQISNRKTIIVVFCYKQCFVHKFIIFHVKMEVDQLTLSLLLMENKNKKVNS